MSTEKAFHYNDVCDIFCTTPSGLEIQVAEANDQYWADAIVYALNLEREMREL
jgi:hypothetical protein